MKVLVIEDENPAAKRVVSLIKELVPSAEILDVLDSVEGSVKWLKTHPTPELILMDIHLADGNSFLIFEQVEVKCPVIFATAYDEYAIKAFKVNSIDYLLKPIEKSELKNALEKFKNTAAKYLELDIKSLLSTLKAEPKEYKQRFLVKVADRLVPIQSSEVCYFLAEEKSVFIQTETHKYPIDFTLEQLEELVDPFLFFRLNRKFLVQLKSVNKIFNHLNGKLKILLKPDFSEEIYVSRERASEFKDWLEK